MSMTLPYQEPLVPRDPGARLVPEPPRRGEARRPAVRNLHGPGDVGGLVGRALDAAPARRRQPARCRLACQQAARGLVRRSAG